MSVCPPKIASERKELRTLNFANRLLLAISRPVLEMGPIGPQTLIPTIKTKLVYRNLGNMESPIRTKFDIVMITLSHLVTI